MQDLIKCSIVIPCYNSENSIKVLIEELLNLNLKKFKIIEIICINDFSNDDTLQILQDIKKIHKRGKTIMKKYFPIFESLIINLSL